MQEKICHFCFQKQMKTENQNNVIDYSRKSLHLLLKNAIFAFEINLITDRCQETLILICLQFILLRKLTTLGPAWPCQCSQR